MDGHPAGQHRCRWDGTLGTSNKTIDAPLENGHNSQVTAAKIAPSRLVEPVDADQAQF